MLRGLRPLRFLLPTPHVQVCIAFLLPNVSKNRKRNLKNRKNKVRIFGLRPNYVWGVSPFLEGEGAKNKKVQKQNEFVNARCHTTCAPASPPQQEILHTFHSLQCCLIRLNSCKWTDFGFHTLNRKVTIAKNGIS